MAEKKTVPQFKSLEEEAEFWDSHSATEFEAKEVTVQEVFQELQRRPGKRRISLSLDEELFDRLQNLAAKRRLPTATLVRELLAQEVNRAS